MLASAANSENFELAKKAEAVTEGDSLETAREKFKPLSQDAVEFGRGQGQLLHDDLSDGEGRLGAKGVANLYYGGAMLRCGGLK